VRRLLPLTEVRARVRAVNRSGAGPWSDEGSAATTKAVPEPDRVPLSEIPLLWSWLDLDDIYKENEKQTGGDGVVTAEEKKEQQDIINAVSLTHMAPIKIAYRYYCLAGCELSLYIYLYLYIYIDLYIYIYIYTRHHQCRELDAHGAD